MTVLAYMTRAEVLAFLDEIAEADLPTEEIGFTGGEPFMNPDIIAMLEDALARGFRALVLTNAMQPMQRPRIQSGLLALREAHGSRLVMRVSLDHYGKARLKKSAGPEPSTRPSTASIGSRATASPSRSPAAPAGARMRRKSAQAMPP